MAPPETPPRGRGRGRGRGRSRGRSGGGLSNNASHQSQWPRYSRQEEHCGGNELKRIVSNFASCLHGAMREEAVCGLSGGDECSVFEGDVSPEVLDRKWLVITLIEGHDGDTSSVPGQPDPAWRVMRDKLEAMSVLSVLACTETYAWRRNLYFWSRFVEHRGSQKKRDSKAKSDKFGHQYSSLATTAAVPAPRDDALMPRFLLDFSFSTVSADMVMLVRRVLLGSDQLMRINFINAMASLATVPPRTPRPRTIPVSLRFTRCKFESQDGVAKMVELVLEVNRCRQTRQRELSKATSKEFYYQIVELDFTGVELSVRDLEELSRLSENTEGHSRLRLALDKTVHVSSEGLVPFGTLAMSWFQPEQPLVRPQQPETKQPPHTETTQVLRNCTSTIVETSLNTSSLSSARIVFLLSAVGASGSTSTKRLSLRNAFNCCNTGLAWAWLAYSVWCGESTSQLVALDLSSNPLQHSDAATVKRIMTSEAKDRPKILRSLLSGPDNVISLVGPTKRKNKSYVPKLTSSDAAVVWVNIPAGSPLSVSLRARTKLVLREDVVVRVVDVVDDHVVVLVPAYGFVYAARKVAIPVEVVDTENEDGTRHLKELRMNGMQIDEDDNSDVILGSLFFNLSMPSLVKLELNGNRLGSLALRAVLTACPQLKSLSMECCELQSISELLNGYSSGSCRVESLNLSENHIAGRDAIELCRLMVDAESPASQIRSLNLSNNPISQQGLRALSAMVRNNSLLVELVLDRAQDMNSTFRPVFYQFHDQPLGFQPLSGDRKNELNVGLLALASNETLESSVVDHICEFAGSEVHRRIVWL